jgi:NADPH:quinone reductase-like Zn-dependent oxidoreductase
LDFLQSAELAEPSPGAHVVRVRVHASSLNPADFKVALGQVKFLHGRRFPMVLGYDFSGVIDAVGSEAQGFKPGDEVFGFLPYGPSNNQGAFADKIIADANCIALKPKNVSHVQAAAAATSGLTALQSLRDLGNLKAGGRVLITGVSGGVGSVAIPIAARLGAGEIVAVGSGRGLELARKLGAKKTLDRKSQDVIALAEAGFDVIFDASASYRWSQWKGKLCPGGTFVTTLPSVAFAADKLKSLAASSRVRLVTVKSRHADLALLANWLASGLTVPLDSTIMLGEVAKSLARLNRGEVLGKVAVTL